jgi:hypothetical protein
MQGPMSTFKGRVVDIFNLKVEDIEIEDIAHSLGMLCRFGGHTDRFYSVAQHSIRVARLQKPEHQLEGLLHDAGETYVQDLIRPIKRQPEMSAYVNLEDQIYAVIARKFGLSGKLLPFVKYADNAVLKSEIRQFLPQTADIILSDTKWFEFSEPLPVESAWSPETAEDIFLSCFKLMSEIHYSSLTED